MAGGLGYFYGQALLNLLNGDQAFVPPGTWYAALLTALPTDAGGGTEVTGGGYARISVTNNTTNFPSSNSSATQATGTTINWGTASANWGTIVGVAFYDASSAGNLGIWGPLTVPQTVNSGNSFSVSAGNGIFTAS